MNCRDSQLGGGGIISSGGIFWGVGGGKKHAILNLNNLYQLHVNPSTFMRVKAPANRRTGTQTGKPKS